MMTKLQLVACNPTLDRSPADGVLQAIGPDYNPMADVLDWDDVEHGMIPSRADLFGI